MPSKRARKAAAPRPIVIGHRGASGYVPEHTLTSYFIAIQQGADYAEPDLVMTKDGVLVARHENEISGTTDVADHPEFARRRTRKSIDGVELEGWFTEDFTLAELKTLRARERIPDIRPANTRFNDQFEIPTFDEILRMLRALEVQRAAARAVLAAAAARRPAAARKLASPAARRPDRASLRGKKSFMTDPEANLTTAGQRAHLLTRPIGVYPETKHPSYFDGIGLSMDRALLQTLTGYGYKGPKAPVFIQSFEVVNLKRLRKKTSLPMVQLIEAEGSPFNDLRSYAEIISPTGLKDVATYANAIGPNKSLIIPRDANGKLTTPTSLVRDAHAAGLGLHPWTFRAESNFLPAGTDLTSEIKAFVAAGVDGFFTDQPDIGARVVAEL